MSPADTHDSATRRHLEQHREVWRRKPVLASIYQVWFDALLGGIASGASVLEIGSGPGFLAAYARARRPDLRWISSDVVETPWNSLVADALRLPFRERSLDALVVVDLLHHLARPAAFFLEAGRVLREGALVSTIEPWVTPLSFPIYRWTHPEGCTLDIDPWDPFGAAESRDKEPLHGNSACAWRLVRTTPASRWRELGFEPPCITLFNGLAYLASFGFRAGSMLPPALAPLLMRLDERLARLSPLLALRALLTWRRLAGGETDRASALRPPQLRAP
jgi:SAM-dependent methyltransferase